MDTAPMNLTGQTILVRADLNVPLSADGSIIEDFRLTAIVPTLTTLLEQGATVIVLTHIGRPIHPDPKLSTRVLVDWFKQHQLPTYFAPTIEQAHTLSTAHPNTLIVLENLRFFPGEKKNDPELARRLATLGDAYLNDAFAVLHRTDCSTAALPQAFPKEKRFIGTLVTQEIAYLEAFFEHQEPRALVMGGGKSEEKINAINALLGQVQLLFVCPTLSNLEYSNSSAYEHFRDMQNEAKKRGTKIFLPIDYLIAQGDLRGNVSTTDDARIPSGSVPVSVGPKTIAAWKPHLEHAQSIFFNAAAGLIDKPDTLTYTCQLITTIAQSPAYSVVGGGHSVALARHCGQGKNIDFLSTGGGATLLYLSQRSLPGVDMMG